MAESGRQFGWLQHHGAASGQRWGDFQHHLVHRPVPRCDQTANPDGFTQDDVTTTGAFKLIVFQRIDKALQMPYPDASLSRMGKLARRAHLGG